MLSKFKLGQRIIKILGSLLLVYFYIFWLQGWLMYSIAFAIIGFTIYAFFAEKTRIESGNERFRGDNLFFRYGEEINYRSIPIPVKSTWKTEDSIEFGNSILNRIQNEFLNTYGNSPLNGKQIVSPIWAADSERPSDTRGFLKISFTGGRGAIFSRFINYQILGKNIVLHRMVHLLGIAQWYEMIFFFLASPFSILFWIYRWIRGEYSVYGAIAGDVGNSFEIMDLRAYYVSTHRIIEDAIIEELKSNDLLSEELGMTLQNVFNNYNFGNQNIGGSGNMIIDQIK